MNKEAKIGLTIILMLMLAFAAVLAKRLYSSHWAQESLATEDKGEEKTAKVNNTIKETPIKADKAKTANASAGQPTVVAATTIFAKPPQGSSRDDEQWSTASDSGNAKITAGSASDLQSPPSYMPEPPKPDAENRYGRNYNSDRYASRTSTSGDITDSRNSFRHDYKGPSTRASRTYTVAEGDSLFDIARCELGKATRWVEIYDLNSDLLGKDIEALVPGTQIVLPDDNAQKADPLTRREGMDYR